MNRPGRWNAGGQLGLTAGLPSFLVRPISRRSISALLAAWVLLHAHGAASSDEFRAVWVVRHTLTAPEKIAEMVETAKQAGFNALFVQVRGRGDAYYRSGIIPRGEDVPDGAFDPLSTVVRLARKAGIEVHAWINVFLAWHPTDRMPKSFRHVLHQHPEWFMTSADGVQMGRKDLRGVDLVSRGVEGRYLSPGLPEVRDHLLEVVEELVTRYDVDGVHLDYVRYPNVHYDFNTATRSRFEGRYGFDPRDILTSDRVDRPQRRRLWRRWRTDQVSLTVEEIHKMLQRLNPSVVLSAAVKPDLPRAYQHYGQDWIRWINRQTVDFVVPMFYFGSTPSIVSQIEEARNFVTKGHLYAGIGDWNQTPAETLAQIEHARRLGLKGVALFSYGSLSKRPEELRQLREGPFRQPASTPPMPWKQGHHEIETEAR